MDPSNRDQRMHPNHEAIPPEIAPGASPTLDAPPRVVKQGGWGWWAVLFVVTLGVLLYWWR